VMQMMNVILCRHPFKSSLSVGLFDNRYILMGIAAELGVILFIVDFFRYAPRFDLRPAPTDLDPDAARMPRPARAAAL